VNLQHGRGKIALSQNTSLDGSCSSTGIVQSPGPTDVPFKYTGCAVDFDGGPEGARFDYEEEGRNCGSRSAR
jgi:hypothetical protein